MELRLSCTNPPTHWPLGDVVMISKGINIMSISYKIALRWMPQNTSEDKSNIGAGNGPLPSGNEPLP